MTPGSPTRAKPGEATPQAQPGTEQATSARAFVTALAARGITFAVRNNRLWWLPPKTAASLLTAAERDYIATNRNQLKEIVSGDSSPAEEWPCLGGEGQLTNNSQQLTGEDHASEIQSAPTIPEEIRAVIFGNTEAEIERRSREATAVMLKMIRYGHPDY